jgi:hypothetical protein
MSRAASLYLILCCLSSLATAQNAALQIHSGPLASSTLKLHSLQSGTMSALVLSRIRSRNVAFQLLNGLRLA